MTVEQAYALDAKNSNTLWADTISKEMENVRVAFDCRSHMTKAVATIMNASIVSR